MADVVTTAESASLITAVLGGTGVSGIIIAVVGYLTAARQGRKGDTEKVAGAFGISALLADADSITKLSISLQQVALSADKVALLTAESRQDLKDEFARMIKLANDFLDELRELRRAVEDKHRRD
jgi:hypothetical protein